MQNLFFIPLLASQAHAVHAKALAVLAYAVHVDKMLNPQVCTNTGRWAT